MLWIHLKIIYKIYYCQVVSSCHSFLGWLSVTMPKFPSLPSCCGLLSVCCVICLLSVLLSASTLSFPGVVYKNKTQFNGKIYWNRYSKCWVIFQHIQLQNRDICHTVGPSFISYVVEVCCLGLEPLWCSSLPLCHSENTDANWTGFS